MMRKAPAFTQIELELKISTGNYGEGQANLGPKKTSEMLRTQKSSKKLTKESFGLRNPRLHLDAIVFRIVIHS